MSRDLTRLRSGVTRANADALAAQKKLADAQRTLTRLKTSGAERVAAAEAAVKKAESAVAASQKKVEKAAPR